MRGVFWRIGHWHQLIAQLRRPPLGRAQRSVHGVGDMALSLVVAGCKIPLDVLRQLDAA